MTVKTGIGFTTRDRIYVRGRDLADEVLGKMDFIDMIYFTATGKAVSYTHLTLPTNREV